MSEADTAGPLREVRRTRWALSNRELRAPAARSRAIPSRLRAIMQIVLTVILIPLCLYALIGPSGLPPSARQAASGLLGAIVAFWLKD